MEELQQFFSLFSDFTNPKKRVFVGYLFLSLLIALGWLVLIKRRSLKTALTRVFDRKVFFSKSALADYQIFIVNRLFIGFISPLMLSQMAIATSVYFFLHRLGWVEAGYFSSAPLWLAVSLFTFALFLADDFTKYLAHRWMHKWPVLWAIHKTHHSAETLTPITVYRVHPLEGILYGIRGVVTQGSVIPLFVFLFGDKVDLYTVLGANILVFFFHITGSNLRHSHIDIRYWRWLEHILISPAQHQVHHSIAVKHYDKNFGAALAIWDWLFGSLHLSDHEEDLEFGLLPSEKSSASNLAQIYTRPFVDIWLALWRPVRRVFRRIKGAGKSRSDHSTLQP
ncbi:MAG: sterol desaturase family protein [Pelagimonas sp.]|jgi:sterol desaturase/sphingolipid hydroxylase (fatty acid hydroxylase superfamily)|nr:sterol desaturase family protein [Pelagimonas sp.]